MIKQRNIKDIISDKFLIIISVITKHLINLMQKLKLTTVGSSTGTVIPKEMLNRLKVEKGDTLFAIETPNGYLLTPYNPEVEEQLELGRDFMKQYRETFHTLAK